MFLARKFGRLTLELLLKLEKTRLSIRSKHFVAQSQNCAKPFANVHPSSPVQHEIVFTPISAADAIEIGRLFSPYGISFAF